MKVFVYSNDAGIGSSASIPITCAGIFRHGTADRYPDGFLDFESGYAESGRAVAALIEGARSIGGGLREHAKFCALMKRPIA